MLIYFPNRRMLPRMMCLIPRGKHLKYFIPFNEVLIFMTQSNALCYKLRDLLNDANATEFGSTVYL